MSTGNLNLEVKWGPFSSNYLGISHIIDFEKGNMLDLALFVGRKNPNSVILPNSTFDYIQDHSTGNREADVHAMPENVAKDYSSYSLRYFIDQNGDSALAEFTVENNDRMRCEITFYNNSDENREYFYGLNLSIKDTRKKVFLKKIFKNNWLAAQDYTSINSYKKSFEPACRPCLSRLFSWGIEDKVLANAFGGWLGDKVTYKTSLVQNLEEGYIYFRYIKYGECKQKWILKINEKSIEFSFPQTWIIPGGAWGKSIDEYKEWRLFRIPLGKFSASDINIELSPLDAPTNDQARIWLDGMLFSDGLIDGDDGNDVLLSPQLIEENISEIAKVTLDSCSEYKSTFKLNIPSEKDSILELKTAQTKCCAKNGQGSYLNYLVKHFELPEIVTKCDEQTLPWGAVESEMIAVPGKSARTVSFSLNINGGNGKRLGSKQNKDYISFSGPYSEMIARMCDILLFNINYPMQITELPSHYPVPSKYFPMPFSWDAGFSALGTAYIDPDFALSQTNYFFAEEKYNYPFIYMGSPVPTQFYTLWEIYQIKNDLKILSDNYIAAKRMYNFYLGRIAGSFVNVNNDGLLSTYIYNYNLGIDDHPIQRWGEKEKITDKGLYSLILIAQMLRVSRIMRNIAYLLEMEVDIEQYSLDSEMFAEIIDNKMWDEKSSLYTWLYKTDKGIKQVKIGNCSGDRSSCTFFPLFAGQTTHKEVLIKQMKDRERFNTDFGISSVDMTAPYYNPNGYWNGGIWPVMQWYIWRGLLEAGELIFARRVADKILKTWQNCLDNQHHLGEHFMISNAKMNGAPNFGGLNAVLIAMYAAYFSKYNITTTYDVIIHNKIINPRKDKLSFEFNSPFLEHKFYIILINMGEANKEYTLSLNDNLFGDFISDEYGHIAVQIPNSSYGKNKKLISAVILPKTTY